MCDKPLFSEKFLLPKYLFLHQITITLNESKQKHNLVGGRGKNSGFVYYNVEFYDNIIELPI